MPIISLAAARLARQPVVLTVGRRRFRVTRPGLARLIRWWRRIV